MNEFRDVSKRLKLRILSISKSLPTPTQPSNGVFVFRRLQAMRRLAEMRVVQPVPYFPLVRPLPAWAGASRKVGELAIEPAPMPYIPGVLKGLDGWLLGHAVSRHLPTSELRGYIDLIDAHFGYPDGVGAVRFARAAGIPAFVTVRGNETEYLRDDSVRGQLVDALKQAAGCVCVSRSLKRLLIEQGVPASGIAVVQNGIDRQLFRPGNRSAARKRLGVNVEGRLIVSVGMLIERKRHHVLIKAMPAIRERFPDARLAVLGGERGDEPQYLRKLKSVARDCGVEGAVEFPGALPPEQVIPWLQAADTFALCTEREGCCNAVLEALATGLPVVTTPVGENAHYVQDGRNGFLVPVDDVAATARGIISALDRSWNSQQISDGLQVSSWDGVAVKVVDFLRSRLEAWLGYEKVLR